MVIVSIEKHRRQLPHWSIEGAIYFVTFRLYDSLPPHFADPLRLERNNILETARQVGRSLTPAESRRLRELSRQVEGVLDKGHGHCWMKDPQIADLVASALLYFDTVRYELLAWAVMPNHVHVVVKPAARWTLAAILHSWKSFSAHEARRQFHCPPRFWQREYFDRIVRDQDELHRAIRYVEDNPIRAGLQHWKWVSRTLAAS